MLTDNPEQLFEQWLTDHRKLIFKVVNAYEASSEKQDDLFQEILLQLWLSIPRFRGKAKETTWIYRVALNTALVWRRGETRRRKRHHRLILHSIDTSDTQENAHDCTLDRELLFRVYAAIRELPKIDGSLVLLYLDGISYDEIAEILGISKSNVGVRLNRARKRLAQSLKGLIDDF